MNFANLRSKTSLIVLSAAVSATLVATDAAAQRRGGGGGGRPGGGGGGGGRPMGQGVPRGPVVRGGGSHIVGAPFRGSYYRPYYRSYYRPYYRPYYGYGPAFSFGFYAGYPFYGYGSYGYPYGYYRPYPYYGYPYAYPNGGYPYAGSYAYPAAYGGNGYVEAYAGVRIQGAPSNAEVFADGNSVGIVDDFDGTTERLELTPGAHSIEIRAPGMTPMVYDVNVQPGRTVTIHVR
jgi:PEGA domain